MVSITHTLTTSVVSQLYRVHDIVTASVDIAPEIHVFDTTLEEYSHVATVADMVNYPNTLLQAQTDGKPFYRLAEVTKDFSNLYDAEKMSENMAANIQFLVNTYNTATNEFIGTTTETITSP